MRASGCSARARPSCRRARRSLGRPAREQSLRPAGGRTPFARRPGTATRTALPFAIRTSEALSATPTHTDPRATVIARAPRIGMRRSTVEVSGRIRFTTFPFPATAQTASDVARMAPGQIPPRSNWILATVRPVSGEILETVESSWFATHSEPCPTAMPVGRPPTWIRRVTRFVPESMRSTSPARMSNAQTAPKPAASPTPPGWIRATIRFVSGSIRTISSRPREAQSDPDAAIRSVGALSSPIVETIRSPLACAAFPCARSTPAGALAASAATATATAPAEPRTVPNAGFTSRSRRA